MKTKLLTIFAMLWVIAGFSQSFSIEGLDYEVISTNPNEVQLTGGTPPTSDLIIPETVTDNTIEYNVVSIANNAFENAGLTSVSFPGTLRELGQVTFRFNSLTTVTIPEGITEIPQRCFSNNDLTSITLPNSLEVIGFRSFEVNELTELTIPQNVSSISSFAFLNNPLTDVSSLNSTPPSLAANSFSNRDVIDLTIPDGTEASYDAAGWTGFASINGTSASFEVNGLTYFITSFGLNEVEATGGTTIPVNLVLPETVNNGLADFTVVAIRNNAFENKNITSVQLPSTIRSIGNLAFQNNQLTSVTIPTSVTSIGFRAFRINQIGSLIIPNSVTTLGGGAFEANNLSTLTISENITSIPDQVFRSNQLTSVTIPANINAIGDNSFRDNPLTEVMALGTSPASISGGSGDSFFGSRNNIDLTVPNGTEDSYLATGWTGFATINGEVPLEVGNTFDVEGLFYTITSLNPNEVNVVGGSTIPTNLIIAETVLIQGTTFTIVGIGNNAFQNDQLNSVTISATISAIGTRSFANTPLTEVIALGNSPATIEGGSNDSFLASRNNIDLTVPNGTEATYQDAGWTGFATINGVVPLEVGNTFNVDGLSYTITALAPNEVHAAGGTTIPTDLIIPETVVIQGVTFTVVGIGNSAYENSAITSVSFPNTIRVLGQSAFRSNAIIEVVIPEGITEIPNRCFSSNDLVRITLPESLETIGFRSFERNELEDITIPDNVTNIQGLAFDANSLRRVVIPANVTAIGGEAFDRNNLVEIVAEGITPAAIQGNSFTGRGNIDLFVPVGTTQAYIDAAWTDFKTVTEANKTLDINVFLQGAALNPFAGEEDLMRDDLRANNLLPTTSPYGDGATVNAAVFEVTGNNAIVDWILVELRDANTSTSIIESSSALLQRDGDVVATNGTSLFEFAATPDDYLIAIKHRNHLGVMLASAKRLSPVITSINLRDAGNPIAFGSNAQTDFGMPVNTIGLWAGNVNGDGVVQFSGATPDAPVILSGVLNNAGNFLNLPTFSISGYNNNDINMDGSTQFAGASPDTPLILQNVLAHPGNFLNFSTFAIIEQLPENVNTRQTNRFQNKFKTKF